MAVIKPFCALRPRKDIADKVAALPYDVYNRKEAKVVAAKEPLSFLRIDRAESQLADDIDTYDERVYAKAVELFENSKKDGVYEKDSTPCFYLYELIMDGRSQTGIVGCASIDDYISGVIKKHENTRAEKEVDRIKHVDSLSAQTGPIFLAYKNNEELQSIISMIKQAPAEVNFTSEDGITHKVWVISDTACVNKIAELFDSMNSIYIADGHHRCASACKVGLKRRQTYPDYTGEEEFNYFLSVLFADSELMIMDYNRVIKDLNNHTEATLLDEFSKVGTVNGPFTDKVKPSKKGEVGIYTSSGWYKLTINNELIPNDPVDGLDVSVLQKQILTPVFGIDDPRTDNRIDFVGGIRGLDELERRVNDDCKIAFAMYPTSIQELFDVADAGLLMPPKSTWFEPKLRSGLFIHEIER